VSIAEIRQRAAAAIEGPWSWFGHRDDVYLATNHSGRQYILQTDTVSKQWVYDEYDHESYTLEEAREKYLLSPETLPPADYSKTPLDDLKALAERRGMTVEIKGEDIDWPDGQHDLFCEALAEWDQERGLTEYAGSNPKWWATQEGQESVQHWLAGDVEPEEGLRYASIPGSLYPSSLVRGATPKAQLRVRTVTDPEGWGRMRPAADIARFEVLGGRTIEQAERELDRVNLYRDDIVGLATPEMEFIANSRSDVDELLAAVDRLAAALAAAGLPEHVVAAISEDRQPEVPR
jgi:hypothetical protein